MTGTPRNHAALRLVTLTSQARTTFEHTAKADAETSVADARAALTLARGVPTCYVDPATGGDYSPRAYRRARQAWIDHQVAFPEDDETVYDALAVWLDKAPGVVAAVEAVIER